MRWMYLLAGISGAILFYTGNLLWIENDVNSLRHAMQSAVRQRLSVR
jgi:hypothetical protein